MRLIETLAHSSVAEPQLSAIPRLQVEIDLCRSLALITTQAACKQR